MFIIYLLARKKLKKKTISCTRTEQGESEREREGERRVYLQEERENLKFLFVSCKYLYKLIENFLYDLCIWIPHLKKQKNKIFRIFLNSNCVQRIKINIDTFFFTLVRK